MVIRAAARNAGLSGETALVEIRCDWNRPRAKEACARLVDALRGRRVPVTLFRQHLPRFEDFAGQPLDPEALLVRSVQRSLDDHRFAWEGPQA